MNIIGAKEDVYLRQQETFALDTIKVRRLKTTG